MVICLKCNWSIGGMTEAGEKYVAGSKCPQCGNVLENIEILGALLGGKPDDCDAVELVRQVREREYFHD